MALSGRREKIIQAVVDTYIDRCEPISSAEIQEKYLPDVSSATIRNELLVLEELGYLEQPHASSGRVPTAQAYRLYVNQLMPKKKLTRAELATIKRYFGKKLNDIDEIVEMTAKVISEITNLTSVAYIKDVKDAEIKNIKLVDLSEEMVLFVIVTDKAVISDTALTNGADVEERFLNMASDFTTSIFKGKKISEVENIKKLVKDIRKEYEEIFNTIIKIIKNYSGGEKGEKLILEGSAKILEQPEYNNVQKAKAVLKLLDTKEQLYPLIKDSGNMDLSIKIGKDDQTEDMPDCAIVTVNCKVNGVNVGNAGVIGPMRMDYPKVVSVLEYIGKTLNSLPEGKIDDDKESD